MQILTRVYAHNINRWSVFHNKKYFLNSFSETYNFSIFLLTRYYHRLELYGYCVVIVWLLYGARKEVTTQIHQKLFALPK